jgi:hypothetical protein
MGMAKKIKKCVGGSCSKGVQGVYEDEYESLRPKKKAALILHGCFVVSVGFNLNAPTPEEAKKFGIVGHTPHTYRSGGVQFECKSVAAAQRLYDALNDDGLDGNSSNNLLGCNDNFPGSGYALL